MSFVAWPATEDRTDAAGVKDEDPCGACGVKYHRFKRCFLVQGKENEKPWISQTARDTFKNNMKTATFKKRVDDYRKELKEKEKKSSNE